MITGTRAGSLTLAVVVIFISACDEQTATINEESALRTASCALSPTTLYNLTALANTIENQTPGACPGGGLILREESNADVRIVADHCVTTNNTTLQGSFYSTQISATPAEYSLDFDQISLVDSNSGSQVDGEVRYLDTETNLEFVQNLSFDALQLQEIEDTSVTTYLFAQTDYSVTQSKATSAATFDYHTTIELCGTDYFGLEVDTSEPLRQLESEASPSSGVVNVRAQDGSTLTITLQGDELDVLLDSNGDSVNDGQLSMTWGEAGVITVASRQAAKANMRLLPRFKSD